MVKLHLQPCLVSWTSIFILAAAGLFASVLWSFVVVFRVIRPRGARYTASQEGHNLMWQDHVLLHENNEVYFSAVRVADRELILRNLTDQVYELAHISKEKMQALAKIRAVAWLGFGSWVVLIGSGLIFREALKMGTGDSSDNNPFKSIFSIPSVEPPKSSNSLADMLGAIGRKPTIPAPPEKSPLSDSAFDVESWPATPHSESPFGKIFNPAAAPSF